MAYTFEDFQKAMQSSNLTGNFSDADLRLAQTNPDTAMSILKYKLDYRNATTDEMRALANAGAEGVRSSYGGYKGGGDGGSFYLDPLSPGSFTADAAPSYNNNYAGTIEDLFNKQLNYGEYSYGQAAPEYNNRYDQPIQDILGELLNREDFRYDPANDQLYSQYRKAYTREGQRATQDALGAAAAASGGIPSSYASTAATQAGDYYAAQMTDKIPELYELAYNKYLNDYNMQLSDLSAVQGAEQSDYDKFLNEMQQYNTDRNFDYSAYLDQYNMIGNNLQTASGLEQLDYTKHLDELGQYNTDRSFNYGQLLDEVNSQTQERQEAMNNALTAAEYGDYSQLNKMGINTENNSTDWERKYNLALLAAEYGDYSGLKALGIQPDSNGLYNFTAAASGKSGGSSGGSGGSSSGGSSGGSGGGTGGTSPTALSDSAIQALKTQYGGTSLTADQWAAIKASNTWVTDEMLSAAGFSQGGTGGGGGTVTDYDSAIAYMKQNGVDAGVRSGMMTRSEWSRRKASLQQYGTGGTEVKNYDTYAAYVQDYVQYAASK